MYIEVIHEQFEGTVLSSSIREATEDEIAEAKRKCDAGQCEHRLVVDRDCWPYHIRSCALCGAGLGAI